MPTTSKQLTVDEIREAHFKENPSHEEEFPSFPGQTMKFKDSSFDVRKIHPKHDCPTCVLLMEIQQLKDEAGTAYEMMAGDDI